MANHSIKVFTFGETAYRIGLQIKKKGPRNADVISFMHPKDNFKGQAVVSHSHEDFNLMFEQHLDANERPSSLLARMWQWLTRQRPSTAHKIVIIAGLGGNYSSEYAPKAAQIAHRRGYLVTAVVQLPFKFEGQKRYQRAEEALRQLQKYTSKQVILDHRVLTQQYKDLSAYDYFNKVDTLAIEAVLAQ